MNERDEHRAPAADDYHIPVLRDEVLEFLRPPVDGCIVDGTVGGGGHAASILGKLSARGTLIGFDRDAEALREAGRTLRPFGDRVVLLHDNFSNIPRRLDELNIRQVDGILLDLGVSSHQINADARGFSFQRDCALDMRMDRSQRLDAAAIINTYDERRLTDILKNYGEEPDARRIVKYILAMRNQQPIRTTGELAAMIRQVGHPRFLTKTLARVFQALRIEVNGELHHLREGLNPMIDRLKPGGRIVVLSYHSLEDRIVKECFVAAAKRFAPSGTKLLPDIPLQPRLRIVTKKPVAASDAETARNPRARSAKLRAAERIG